MLNSPPVSMDVLTFPFDIWPVLLFTYVHINMKLHKIKANKLRVIIYSRFTVLQIYISSLKPASASVQTWV